MAPATSQPIPGNMTVPPLFGWGEILAVLVLVVVVAVAFFVVTAVGTNAHGRDEWHEFLDARSHRTGEDGQRSA